MPIAPEYRLTDADELLHRQVNPSFVQDGRISSQVFKLNSHDDGQLSVSRGSKIEPRAAWERYRARGNRSCGVVSVSVGECNQLDLQAFDDVLEDDDAHGLIDMTGLSKSQAEKKAAKLTALARARGWQYQDLGSE